MPRIRKTKMVVNALKDLGWPSHVINKFSPDDSEFILSEKRRAPEGRITRQVIADALNKEGANEAPLNGENHDNNSV